MKFEYIEYHKIVSDDELITDLRKTAKRLELQSLSMRAYDENGKFSSTTISRRFGTWNQALYLANLDYKNKFYSEYEMFENIETVWIKLGRQPTRRDMDNTVISNISSGCYIRNFGKWSNALKAFIVYINSDIIPHGLDNHIETDHKTKRDVNLRMRFIVMQRDYFKCCACGASPAKDPSVVLHVDHIIPWAKGGETTLQNLQTLCSKCNLGKSDLL